MKTTENELTPSGPLSDALRLAYYDNRKQQYFTEWRHFVPGERPAQQPLTGAALVTATIPEPASLLLLVTAATACGMSQYARSYRPGRGLAGKGRLPCNCYSVRQVSP